MCTSIPLQCSTLSDDPDSLATCKGEIMFNFEGFHNEVPARGFEGNKTAEMRPM